MARRSSTQEWHLRDPAGREWHFVNLQQFIRDNRELFPPESSVKAIASGMSRVRAGAPAYGWSWAPPYAGLNVQGHRKCVQCLQIKPSSAYDHQQRRCRVCVKRMSNAEYKRFIKQKIETPTSVCVMCKVKMPRIAFDTRKKRCKECCELVPDEKYKVLLNLRARRPKKPAKINCVTCGDAGVEAYANSSGACCACADYRERFPNRLTTLRDRREKYHTKLPARETRQLNASLKEADRELVAVLLLRENL